MWLCSRVDVVSLVRGFLRDIKRGFQPRDAFFTPLPTLTSSLSGALFLPLPRSKRLCQSSFGHIGKTPPGFAEVLTEGLGYTGNAIRY